MKKNINYKIIENNFNLLADYLRQSSGYNLEREIVTGLKFLDLTEKESENLTHAIEELKLLFKENSNLFKIGTENKTYFYNFFESFNKKSNSSNYALTFWIAWVAQNNQSLNIVLSQLAFLKTQFFGFLKKYEINVSIEILKIPVIEIFIDDLQENIKKMKEEFEEVELLFNEEKYQMVGLKIGTIYEEIVSYISKDKKSLIHSLFPDYSETSEVYKWLDKMFFSISQIRNSLKNINLKEKSKGQGKNHLSKEINEVVLNNPKMYIRMYIDWTKMLFNVLLLNEKLLK